MKINFEGTQEAATLLHNLLLDDGIDHEALAPVDGRGAGDAAMQVVFFIGDEAGRAIVGATAVEAVRRAVAEVRQRFPRARTQVVVEEGDGEPEQD